MKDVISVNTMRESDAYTIKNYVPSKELMYRAANGIYKSVTWHGKVAIVCGTGNNAGDGYALALILNQNDIYCDIVLIKEKFSEDGIYYFNKCKESKIPFYVYSGGDFSEYDMIVDCIFGTGFHGEVGEAEASVIKAINKSGKYVVCADINSGMNGDSGMASLCVKSDITVSIGTLKPGHLLNMAKDNISKLVNCDIGIKPVSAPYGLIEASDIKKIFPKRANFSNKGTYGYITLIGGSYEYSGATKLANLSLSALKAGGGVVRLAVPRCICDGVMPYLLESTLFPLDDADGAIRFSEKQIQGALKNSKAVAIGMGMGERGDNLKIIEYVLKNYEIPVIIDADGLNTLAKTDTSLVKNTRCRVILTPHLGEFSRLTGLTIEEIEKNPVEVSKKYAKENSVILLLKGPTTIITDGERVIFSDTGCPGMATAGSGDVLSGILAGICSANACSDDMLLCVAAGAYINGKAGQIAQKRTNYVSMVASDTVNGISEAISEILNS
ncbi:MAG: NAD(P)H-hydrate dehydratase [Eubacteriales bacterium]